MRVVWTHEQLEFGKHVSCQRILGQHSLDREHQNFRRVLFPQIDGRDVALTTGPTRKPHVALLRHFRREVRMRVVSHSAPGEPNLVRIDDDDIVTGIDVRSIVWTVFTHQDRGQSSRETTDGHSLGIDNEPFGLVVPAGTTIGSFQKRRARSNHNFNLNRKIQTQTNNHPGFGERGS